MSKVTLYEGIKAHLEEIADIKTVALWRNQLERENIEIPFLYPAVFIEFLTSDYMESSSKAFQTLNMTVRLHICFESYETEDLTILDLTQQVYSKLQLKQYGYWGVMKRRNEEQNFDHDNVQDFIQDYDCGQCKDFGADARPSVNATIDTIIITPDIETPLT